MTPTTSNIAGAEAVAWWSQRVVFEGTQVRRIDLFHRLSARPGTTKAEVRRVLETAPPADGNTGPKPPWYWSSKVRFNGKPTDRREVHAILEAHQVPEDYIAQFLGAAEQCFTDDGEEDMIPPSVANGPEQPSDDAKKRLEALEAERARLLARKFRLLTPPEDRL